MPAFCLLIALGKFLIKIWILGTYILWIYKGFGPLISEKQIPTWFSFVTPDTHKSLNSHRLQTNSCTHQYQLWALGHTPSTNLQYCSWNIGLRRAIQLSKEASCRQGDNCLNEGSVRTLLGVKALIVPSGKRLRFTVIAGFLSPSFTFETGCSDCAKWAIITQSWVPHIQPMWCDWSQFSSDEDPLFYYSFDWFEMGANH